MMILLIVATFWLGGTGLVWSTPVTVQPEQVKLAAKPVFASNDFFQSLKATKADNASETSHGTSKGELSADPSEAAFRAQAEKLWVHIQRYQADCGIAAPLGKGEFIESLRQTPLKRVLDVRGAEYATSQDAFAKQVLGDKETIAMCKAGRGGLFFATLEFHRANWDRQVEEAKKFEERERERVEATEASQARGASERKANAAQALQGAAIALGLFMCVALILIFARLEINLRGIQTIVRVQGDAG